jgi:hypothetical protein
MNRKGIAMLFDNAFDARGLKKSFAFVMQEK